MRSVIIYAAAIAGALALLALGLLIDDWVWERRMQKNCPLCKCTMQEIPTGDLP